MEPINPETSKTNPKKPPTTINFDEKLDGFPEEYKAFGRALCEILLKNNENTLNELIKPLKEDIKTLLDEKKGREDLPTDCGRSTQRSFELNEVM